MNVTGTLLVLTEEQLAKYFKKMGAVSSKTAKLADIEDLKNSLETPELLELPLEKYKFIKKTPSGKYYLDESLFLSQQKLAKILVVGILMFVLLTGLFYWLFLANS